MGDPLVLYVVTGAVVLGLLLWVGIVLMTAPDAVSAPAPDAPASPGPLVPSAPSIPRSPTSPDAMVKGIGATARGTDPLITDVPAPSVPSAVVKLPPMRQRLDSHQEIRDGSVPAAVDIIGAPSPMGSYPLSLVTAVGRTDPGTRKSNEDAFAIVDRHHLFVIADGAKEHAAGEVASQLAVESIAAAFDAGDSASFPDDPALSHLANRLRSAVLKANRTIRARASEIKAYSGMATTVVAAYFSPDNHRVHIGHVGDSRCYRIRRSTIELLTSEPSRNRALGTEDAVDVSIAVEAPEPGDLYLLCSAALSHAVGEHELLACVTTATTLEQATTALVDHADLQGSRSTRDNVTVILVRVDAPG